jgi:cytochrome P450
VTTPRLDLDFTDPAVIADPFGAWEEVRAAGRVVWNGKQQGWMIPGYDDCAEVFDDRWGERFGISSLAVMFWFEANNMISVDGKEHGRLRRGLAKYFTPAAIKRTWEPRVREVVDQFLGPLVERNETIELEEFTKLPVVIVAEMLGVPEERHEDFRRWSIAIVDNVAFGQEGTHAREVMRQAIAELDAYLDEELERHRRDRPDDLLTLMVDMPDWSAEEMRSSAKLMLLAAYDTTAKLMGSALLALQQHPDQRRLLAERPELIPNAVEEVLRWDGVATVLVRWMRQDTVFAGTELKAGDRVYLFLGAANRDPSRWDDPHRFDVTRPYRPNLGFGGGPHVCIGAPLARLEVQVALEELLRLAPEYRLREVEYGHTFMNHGPETGVIDVGVLSAAS